MDIGSFFGGALVSLLGVIATIIATNKIESIKTKIESEKHRNMLYLELEDLADECFESLDTIYNLYAKAYMYEKTQNSTYFNNYTMPKSLNLIVLKDALDKCFLDLNKEQRKGLRSFISLVTRIESGLLKLERDTSESHLYVNPEKAYLLLSTFGVVYQLALALANEKERFYGVDKSPSELLDTTLKVKGFSLKFEDLSRQANVAQ